MADFPSSTDLFAFAIFFVPGYLSLNIGSYLMKSKPFGLSWDEKIILSYVWSLIIFLPVFAYLGLPLTSVTVAQALTTPLVLLILASTVAFGFVGGLIYYLSLRFLLELIPDAVRSLGEKIGLGSEEFYFDSTAVRFLKTMWKKRDKNEIIVETSSGRVFRGALASKSFEPTMDILLNRPTKEIPILELVDTKPKDGERIFVFPAEDKWKEFDGWSILVPQGNIRTVSAIESRARRSSEDDS